MDFCLSTNVRIFILLFVLSLCDCEVKVNLTSIVGSSITFPDPVTERGFLSFGKTTIALVYNGVLEIEENIYLNRLHWNSSGFFIFSNLQKNDSGVYSIDSKKGTVFSKYYELKLYDPVSAPVVSCVNVSQDSVSVQCSVTKTEQMTLSWFKGEQLMDSSRSGVLPLTVQHWDYSSEHKCEAQNPAESKTITVQITTVCNISVSTPAPDTERSKYIIPLIIAVVVVAVAIVGLFYLMKKKLLFKQDSTAFPSQDSIQYAQINHKRRDDQMEDVSIPLESSSRNGLTTVYDKIQQSRMTPTYANCEIT